MGDGGEHLLRRAVRIASPKSDRDQPFQGFLRGHGLAAQFLEHRILGILVAQFIEREADTAEEGLRAGDRLFVSGKQPEHFPGRVQVPLRIGLEPPADIGELRVLADAGQDILQGAPVRVWW